MYRFFLLIMLLSTLSTMGLNGQEKKPVLRWGFKSTMGFELMQGSAPLLYPETMQDTIYFSLKQSFTPNFTLNFSSSLAYNTANRECSELNELYGVKYSNALGLNFTLDRHHSFRLNSAHGFSYKREEFSYSLALKFLYLCKLDFFTLTASYSGSYASGRANLFRHSLGLVIYWTLPGRDYLKFRSSLNVILKQGANGEVEGSLLDGGSLNFELILDLNRLKLDDFYKEEDSEEIM